MPPFFVFTFVWGDLPALVRLLEREALRLIATAPAEALRAVYLASELREEQAGWATPTADTLAGRSGFLQAIHPAAAVRLAVLAFEIRAERLIVAGDPQVEVTP
jgi:hypothetical protein